MPNVMAALPNIGGALCSTPQSLADAYTRVPCSNAAKTRNRWNLQGCPKLANRSQPLVGRSFPYCKDEWGGPLLRAKFHPHRCNHKGVGPPKLNFLLRFDQNVEYKRPAGAYPLRDFHKICRMCISCQNALDIKIWLDLLKGLWSYGGFKLRRSGFPQIFSAP